MNLAAPKTPSLHRIIRRKDDGTVREYNYAWRGGPSIGTGTEEELRERQAREIEAHREIRRKEQLRRSRPRENTQAALNIGLKRALSNARRRAADKGREIEIDRDQLRKLLDKQNWRCAVSGMAFDLGFDAERKFTYNPFGISIDRIDCAKGYTLSNIRLVLTALNFAMNEWGEDIYRQIARQVVARELLAGDTGSFTGYVPERF